MADYSGISIPETGELDVFTFSALLRDAIIFNRSHTKDGRKWLKNAWRICQKEPQREKIRQKAAKGGALRYGSKDDQGDHR